MQEQFRSAAEERNVEIEVLENQTCPSIKADPDRLAQIITNLIGNALRYTPAGGKIKLAAECKGNEILMTVSDNGPGIPVESLPAIFDRFYRYDKARSREDGGSGLGLAIARQLAEAHGGRLSAENLKQGGARFTLSIPKVN